MWFGATADNGYGRFWLNRHGQKYAVRPHRYALALGSDPGLVCEQPRSPTLARSGEFRPTAGLGRVKARRKVDSARSQRHMTTVGVSSSPCSPSA